MTDTPTIRHHGGDMFEGYPVDTANTAGDQAVTNYRQFLALLTTQTKLFTNFPVHTTSSHVLATQDLVSSKHGISHDRRLDLVAVNHRVAVLARLERFTSQDLVCKF